MVCAAYLCGAVLGLAALSGWADEIAADGTKRDLIERIALPVCDDPRYESAIGMPHAGKVHFPLKAMDSGVVAFRHPKVEGCSVLSFGGKSYHIDGYPSDVERALSRQGVVLRVIRIEKEDLDE